MRQHDEVIAVVGSDLHLTNKTPVARAEKDWLKVLERYLAQVSRLTREYDVPFLVAGDVFDVPDPPAQVVNFALDCMPDPSWTIPGQHDLEYHNYEDITKTGYWTLSHGNCVKHLIRGQDHKLTLDGLWYVTAFPWGSEPEPREVRAGDPRRLALVHDYIWTKGYSFPKPPMSASVMKWRQKLKGYDVAVFGDNHKGFLWGEDTHLPIMNCGTFTCRKIDEKSYVPFVGILYASGKLKKHFLDRSEDQWATPQQIEDKARELHDFNELMEELGSLGAGSLDFLEALKAAMTAKKVGRVVGDIIRKAAEGKNNG